MLATCLAARQIHLYASHTAVCRRRSPCGAVTAGGGPLLLLLLLRSAGGGCWRRAHSTVQRMGLFPEAAAGPGDA